MTTKLPGVSRRNFIRSTSAFLALPWLESLAGVAPAAATRRMVCINSSFGIYGPAFFPEIAGADYESPEYLSILGPELRKHFTVFSGISHPDIGGDHASESCFLTSAKRPKAANFRNSVSLDYLAGKHVGNATRFPLLSLSTQDSGTLTFSESGAALRSLSQPKDIFRRLFLAGDARQVEQEMERLKRGQSVLDRMGGNFSSLKNKVSSTDRQQLEYYTESIRAMEQQLHASEAWIHKPKPTVDEPAPTGDLDRADSVGRLRILLNLSKLALQTDSTRVISIFIRGMDERPPIDGITEGHHGLAHHGRNPAKVAQLKVIEGTEMAAYRDFLTSMNESSEGSSSLLDSTQVLIGSNFGNHSNHGTDNLPILLAGGGWKHGTHIAGDRQKNTPLGKLFVSMLQRFGVEADQFGSGQGTIEGLS